MSDTWTISVAGQTYGPYTANQLQTFVAEGRLAAHSLVAPQGNDVLVSWITPSGWTNVVQGANSLNGANPFSDASPQIIATNGTISSASFLDVGAAKNHSARYYRLRAVP